MNHRGLFQNGSKWQQQANPKTGQVHLGQPPGGLIAFLTEDRNIIDSSLVLGYKFFGLHEHTGTLCPFFSPLSIPDPHVLFPVYHRPHFLQHDDVKKVGT
jgi:hypothetical protein